MAGMGWTEAEELVVVLETGVVCWYSVLGTSVFYAIWLCLIMYIYI